MPDVPVTGPCGIDNDDVTESGRLNPVADHRLGDRGAADIPQADGGDAEAIVGHADMLTR
jgi:hypothetical protein